jgi:phospholipase C
VTATFNTSTASTYQLTVLTSGSGSGTVTSNPSGINCPQTCNASFPRGTAVTLTAAATTGSTFTGWSGACTGTGTCSLTLNADTSVSATFNAPTGNLSSINHIIYLAQENRSFDQYFGALRGYWAQNGYPDQSFDGLAQFNPTSGSAPLYGPAPAIPGCDPNYPPPSDCVWDENNPVAAYHLQTMCTENTSPSWDEAHVDWNYKDQLGLYPAAMNGFVHAAAHDARTISPTPYYDVNGIRAIGYYDGGDLNYYYFMASNFATSDRWFHPAMTRTDPNREYLVAATSQGYAYPNGTNSNDQSLLTAKTIFQDLQDAGITWKIYVNPQGSKCTGPPYDPACLMKLSYLSNFTYYKTVLANFPQNIAPISQYFTDLQNGTLPQVAQIEPASDAGLDEHGSDYDNSPENVQRGAKYVSSLINALMQSSSWKDSAFILTFDEFGGLYDHVSPQPAVSPDGIKPVDLNPGDVCTKGTGPLCDFTYTGYRVPLIVVSPYARKNYVSHTVADYTAILKLVETRFNLPSLTKRDAAQMDMTEFFDFNNPSWMTPPSPPAQNTGGACYLDRLP